MIRLNNNQKGFTLIELLMAMTVFTFVLAIASASFVQINRIYLKSRTVSENQAQTRAIIEDVASTIRASRNGIPDPVNSVDGSGATFYCIDNVVYGFVLGGQKQINQGSLESLNFVKFANNSGCEIGSINYTLGDSAIEKTELIDGGFAVQEFTIDKIVTSTDSSGGEVEESYLITLAISHGDEDLFEFDGESVEDATKRCRGDAGSFCSITRLQTAATRRAF